MQKIGMTEQGDPVFDLRWKKFVKDGNPAILITKNPDKLYDLLKEMNCDLNLIIHCTITGYGGTIVEPNVPDYKKSIDALVAFVDWFGSNRVVLRIDPILPSKKYVELSKLVLNEVKDRLKDDVCRVRISFYDNYNHSKERFDKLGIKIPYNTFHLSKEKRLKIWEYFGKPELCGEDIIESSPCLSEKDCLILGVEPSIEKTNQRSTCNCLSNKIELLKRTGCQCDHKCAYCYLKKENQS